MRRSMIWWAFEYVWVCVWDGIKNNELHIKCDCGLQNMYRALIDLLGNYYIAPWKEFVHIPISKLHLDNQYLLVEHKWEIKYLA
jgi:hypothetical protein